MTKRVESIQYLRALAAVSVVVFHVVDNEPAAAGLRAFVSEGKAGVDLFFVISGFVMAWSRLNKRLVGPGAFMLHRLGRIVPLYWIATLLVLAIALVAPHLTRTVQLSAPHVIASLFFAPAVNPATGKYEPLVIPGWTLNYEMLFYVIFAGAIVCARNRPTATILISAIAMTALAAIGVVVQPTGVAGFYTNQIVGEFAFGAVAALLVHRIDVPGSRWFVLPLVAAAVLLYLPGDWSIPPLLRRGLPATIMVVSACWAMLPHERILATIGDASYSIYITQTLVIAAIRNVLKHLPLPDLAASSLVTPVLCVGAGVLIWWSVERPIMRRTRRMIDTWLARHGSSAGAGRQQVG